MIGESHPLVLVFYIDRISISNPDFMTVFGDSVNEYIEKKGANMMAFFLPTDTEERVECINPVMLKEADLAKVNKLVNDIAEKFDMKETQDIRDYSFLNKRDCTYAFKDTWDVFGWQSQLATMPFGVPFPYSWAQTLPSTLNKLSNLLQQASGKTGEKIRMNSCFEPLIDQIKNIYEDYDITYDDNLDTDVIYVYLEEIFNMEMIPAHRNGTTQTIPFETATAAEISEHKRRLWGYVKIENYDESDRV